MEDSYITVHDNVDQALANKLLDTNFAGTVLEGHEETEDDFAVGIVVHERKTFDDNFQGGWYPEQNESADNGNSTILRFDLEGCVVFLESGQNIALAIYPAGSTIVDFLRDWDCGDAELCELMADFGYAEEYEKAEESDTDVRIWELPNYYQGTCNAPRAGFACDDEGQQLVFDTYQDAQEWIDNRDSETYYLSHGEAGRPGYVVVK